jgi:hypothetical protein
MTIDSTTCHICDRAESEHSETSGHDFWSHNDALREAREYDSRMIAGSKEARYVAEHRPC